MARKESWAMVNALRLIGHPNPDRPGRLHTQYSVALKYNLRPESVRRALRRRGLPGLVRST